MFCSQGSTFHFDQKAHGQQAVDEFWVKLAVVVGKQGREDGGGTRFAVIVDHHPAARQYGNQTPGCQFHQRLV
jgi:hypothetical protein